jgi:hypothetical protein
MANPKLILADLTPAAIVAAPIGTVLGWERIDWNAIPGSWCEAHRCTHSGGWGKFQRLVPVGETCTFCGHVAAKEPPAQPASLCVKVSAEAELFQRNAEAIQAMLAAKLGERKVVYERKPCLWDWLAGRLAEPAPEPTPRLDACDCGGPEGHVPNGLRCRRPL